MYIVQLEVYHLQIRLGKYSRQSVQLRDGLFWERKCCLYSENNFLHFRDYIFYKDNTVRELASLCAIEESLADDLEKGEKSLKLENNWFVL